MSTNENFPQARPPGIPRQARNTGTASVLHPLHEAAIRIADIGLSRPRTRTRELVNLLLCHGARAWRSTQPEVNIHLHIGNREEKAAIYMRLR